MPTINRRLGGGLAALVKQKVLARHQAKKELEESKTGAKNSDEDGESQSKTGALSKAGSPKKKGGNKDEDSDEGSSSDGDEDEDEGSLEEFEVGKGYDEEGEIDLTEITDQDVQE